MRLTLEDPRFLKDSISIISELVSEARFKITSDAVELVAMDPANVAMVIFKLLSSSFVEYDLKEDVELSINLDNLKKVLRRASPGESLTLETDKAKLKVTLKGRATRTFSLPILEFEGKEQKVPDLKFPVSITLAPQILENAIEDADIIGESVNFQADGTSFVVFSSGDLSDVKIDFKAGDDVKIESTSSAKLKSKYSIEYLKKLVKGGKLANDAKLSFDTNYPLKLEYKVVDKLLLAFILAPRVDND
jgi:proliferating cell nuclear antigen